MNKVFYIYASRLDELKGLVNPSSRELKELISIIKDDEALTVYFYEKKGSGFLPNPSWLTILKEAGEFDDLVTPVGEFGYAQRIKVCYLAQIAGEKPADVLEILGEMNLTDYFAPCRCIEALINIFETSPHDAISGQWLLWRCLNPRDIDRWYWDVRELIKLMVYFYEHDPNVAFSMAERMFEIWKPEKKDGQILREVEARFNPFEYSELMFKGFEHLWKRMPLRAARLLILALERYIGVCSKTKGFDVSEHFYISIENLDSIDHRESDLIAILVDGICRSVREVVKLQKHPSQTDALFQLLGGLNRQIFLRVEMYLLRFVPANSFCSRISEIVANKDYFDHPALNYEYNLLLKDKADDVNTEAKREFVQSIKQMGVSDVNQFAGWFKDFYGRAHTQVDLDKYEARIRASRLYQVQDVFPDLYKMYQESAGATDLELMPRPIQSGFEACPSPRDNAPITIDEMVALGPEGTIDYLLNPNNYEAKKKEGAPPWHTPKECIDAVFSEVVQRQPSDFISLGLKTLNRLDPEQLTTLLNSIWQGMRGEATPSVDKFWGSYISTIYPFVKENSPDSSYRGSLRAVLDTIREGFSEGPAMMDLQVEDRIIGVWDILECLLEVPAHGDTDDKRDPVQQRCTSVPGNALELLVSLARKCKQLNEDLYVKEFQNRLKDAIGNSLNRFQTRPEVLCTLGSEFSSLYWLIENWIHANLGSLFSAEMWDTIWGTYVSWGRPWCPAFKLLVKEGFYRRAIDRISHDHTYEYGKNPDKGLTEHLVIAYFNGWLKSSDIEIWDYFYKKAHDKFRAHATIFMATGFENLRLEDDAEFIERIRSHWKKRLQVFAENVDLYQEEMKAFVKWVKKSPLPPTETLGLIDMTLRLIQSQLPQQAGVYNLVNRICQLARGNEFVALRCIRMLVPSDQGAGNLYLDELKKLLEYILSLESPEEDIVNEGIRLVDQLGRYHQYEYREFYDALMAKRQSD